MNVKMVAVFNIVTNKFSTIQIPQNMIDDWNNDFVVAMKKNTFYTNMLRCYCYIGCGNA